MLKTAFILMFFASASFAQQRWERNYGGMADDWGYSVQQTSDGGYIVAGVTWSFGNDWQIYLIKVNASGDTLWTRNYGGAIVSDEGYSVQQTFDGGYIVTGVTQNPVNYNDQVYLIKINATGDTLWSKTYGDTADDYSYSVQQTADLGYIVAGKSNSFGYYQQVYLIKTDSSGVPLWIKTYGSAGWDDEGYSVQQTTDGGYIVAGVSVAQAYLVKTNASGDTLWTKSYGGAGYDDGWSVQQTQDGGYIVAGKTNSFGNSWQVYLIKTNASGDTLWTKTYGGADWDWGRSVKQTSDGGYIVAGYSRSFGNGYQVYLIKTNASGDTLWTKTYGGSDWEEGYSILQTSDGGYIVAGGSNSFGGSKQVYLIKTDANGNVGVEDNSSGRIKPLTSNLSSSVVPNPFTSFASVPGRSSERFALYDVSGRKVGVYPGARIGEGLSAGVYFLGPDTRNPQPDTRILRIVKLK